MFTKTQPLQKPMMNILALLQCIQPNLSKTNVGRLSVIIEAMLSMTGRITMLGISRWAGKGGSYRTVQRFFNTVIPWSQVFFDFFEQHLHQREGEYFLVGDESVVTKSGKKTYGLDYFFSGLLNKVVKDRCRLFNIVSKKRTHNYLRNIMLNACHSPENHSIVTHQLNSHHVV